MRTIEFINYPLYPSEMVIEQAQWPKLSVQARKQLFEIAFDEATKRNMEVNAMIMRGGYTNVQEAYDTQYKNDDYLDNQNKKEKRMGQDSDVHYRTTQTYGYGARGTLNLKNNR